MKFLSFESKLIDLGNSRLPKFSGTRVMMMPLILGDMSSVPETLAHYDETLRVLFALTVGMNPQHLGKVGYITIDEKTVKPGETHRRSGLHVDGVYRGKAGGWGGGGGWAGGGWAGGSREDGTGMLTVSSVVGCRAYNQTFSDLTMIGDEGEAYFFERECRKENEVILQANRVYWLSPRCIHESLPMDKETNRQFVRLSLPSTAPWFKGYTENPLGIKPTGPILEPRIFMVS